MATEKITSAAAPSPHYSTAQLFLAGRNLAVIALRDILRAGSDRCSIEVTHRPGEAQCDALARAIEGLRNAPTPVIQGFAAVFTDRVGCDCMPTPDHFEQLSAGEMGIEWTSAPSCH